MILDLRFLLHFFGHQQKSVALIRPKYYLFNKNVLTLRQDYPVVTEKKEKEKAVAKNTERTALPRLNTPETAKILATIENPAARVRFETTKKGGLHVRLTEIEE